jgi:hypothetical protein
MASSAPSVTLSYLSYCPTYIPLSKTTRTTKTEVTSTQEKVVRKHSCQTSLGLQGMGTPHAGKGGSNRWALCLLSARRQRDLLFAIFRGGGLEVL